MGTLTAAQVNTRAMYLLQDSGISTGGAALPGTTVGLAPNSNSNVRWTEAEILAWISDAQRTITQLRPNSYNVVRVAPLVPGPRQMIPQDGWLLMTVNSNMKGTDYDRAVTLTPSTR